MENTASEDLNQGLQDSGFKKDQNDDFYYRIKDGEIEKRWTDGDYSQSSDNNSWTKHQKGDQY